MIGSSPAVQPVAMVPPSVPNPEFMVTFTGICEILGAVGLLVPQTRRIAAVALIVYIGLGDGEADAIALGLFGWALFLAVALVIIWRWLCEAPFGPGYWAYTLPAAVLSVAAWQIAHATATEPARYFALALFVAANALIGFIAVRTVAALAQGRFVPR